MKFKSEFANAVKLFVLLILLFWSFTWNSDPNLDFSHSKIRKREFSKSPNDTKSVRSETSGPQNQYSILIETFSAVRNSSRKSSKASSTLGVIIPSFNEWKELKKIKKEKLSYKDGIINHHKRTGQRKLNYASSKCGAKILASNREARQRLAILNEKPDEYMLNPCRVKTWFVIELCDTVEATQIELANYELYSSSPREFSVFWSEVFPTPVWHLLGTFEAKDQRTMQTFDLNSKNLGKFIKVILYSHHGKEHYCLLSVVRVLGYSMVEKFEDSEENEDTVSPSITDNQSGTRTDGKITSDKGLTSKQNIKLESKATPVEYSQEFSFKCNLYFTHCSKEPSKDFVESCPNKLMCRYFMRMLNTSFTKCENNFSSRLKKMPFESNNSTHAKKPKADKNLLSNLTLNMELKHGTAKKVTRSSEDDMLKNYKFLKTLKQEINASALNESDNNDEHLNLAKWLSNTKENSSNTKNYSKQEMISDGFKVHKVDNSQEKCICERGDGIDKLSKMKGKEDLSKEFDLSLSDIEKDVDSAGLIQKESVLFKLTARIKTSEVDLNLINEYLQQLSQSYRLQMEEMQVMFNQTVKAIDAASEKAILIDEKQQESIDILQMKMISLTQKVDYLMIGQRDMLQRVFEMHGFFLILDIIIISTIFTIFLNIFQQKNTLIKYQLLERRII